MATGPQRASVRARLAAIPGARRAVRAARRTAGGHAPRPRASGRTRPAPGIADATDGLEELSPAPATRRTQLATMLSEALVAGGLRHGREDGERGPTLAVLEDELPGLVTVLADLGRRHPRLQVRVGDASGDERDRGPAAELTIGDPAGIAWIQLGVPLRHRRFRTGAEGEVRTVLVRRHERTGRHVATDPGADPLEWTRWFADVVPPGVAGGAGRLFTRPPLLHEPIDLVYTWVDAADGAWQEARRRFASEADDAAAGADDELRYLDREELRYSLRSVELFAPFVRHIYLVTAGQVPAWLVGGHPRLTVVDHRDLFPEPEVLPTFNSHAIEACLHRIPGLAERFVYLNDDMLFGREVVPTDLYTEAGVPKIRPASRQLILDGPPAEDAIPTDWAAYNANHLLGRDLGTAFRSKLKHAPYPLLRSHLAELEDRYPDAFARTRAARFRSRDDLAIPSMFAPFHALATGRAVAWPSGRTDYGYADVGRSTWPTASEQVARSRPRFVCLNATRHTELPLDEQARNLARFLDDLLPYPSTFETDR